jgi:plastocyanin
VTEERVQTEERHVTEERHDVRDRLVMPILLPVGALLFIVGLVFGLSRIFLAVTPTGAVIVAVVTATAVLALAGLLSSVPKVRLGQALAMVLGIAGIALITGGVVAASLVEAPEEGGGEGPAAVAISAPAGAAVDGFAQTEVTAPAGVPFVIDFDNADPSVQHNVAIYPEGGTGAALFSGQIVTGPAQVSYDAPALEAGPYAFICEVHPTTMTGTLTAAEGGGGAPPTLVAKDLAFNTGELHLPAGQEVSLEFDNQDNAVPHNFAIYTEEGGDPIFQGETITGPATTTYTFTIPDAGEFYFHCDVHPQMNGTVLADEGGGGSGPEGGG